MPGTPLMQSWLKLQMSQWLKGRGHVRYASCCRGGAHKEHLPDAVMLRDGEGAEGAVEGSPGLRDPAQVHQELQEVDPHAGHLVHGHHGPLIRVHQPLPHAVLRRETPHREPPFPQVRIPELQAQRVGVRPEAVGQALRILLAAAAGPSACRVCCAWT